METIQKSLFKIEIRHDYLLLVMY